MEGTYLVSVVCTDNEMYMTDASIMNFSDNINESKKFKYEEEAKLYLDDHFIPLCWWIGSNNDKKIMGVYIYSIDKDIVMGRSRYL